MKSLPYTFGTKISMEATKIEITKEVTEAIQVGFKRRISPKEIRTYSSLNTNVCFIFTFIYRMAVIREILFFPSDHNFKIMTIKV